MQFQLWELWLEKGYSPPAPGVPIAPGSIMGGWTSLADPQVPLGYQGHIRESTAAPSCLGTAVGRGPLGGAG